MLMRVITKKKIEKYKMHLANEEKSFSTIDKYIRDIEGFAVWISGKSVEKSDVIAYKSQLTEQYAIASVNSKLASLNSFFGFMEWYDLRVKNIKMQRKIFTCTEKELGKEEYMRLLYAAKSQKNERLYLLMQTVCSTGIRVSELRYITVEAVRRGGAEISCKGKRRQVFIPKQLCHTLKKYIKDKKIKSGAIFVTKNGNPLDRSNIWSDMKKLCKAAHVSEKKVFPHNLRHLFARTYYSMEKDIARLADILGHSSINTTRIYTMESGEIHRMQIQKLGLLRC